LEHCDPTTVKLAKLSTKLFWKFFRPFWPSQNNQDKSHHQSQRSQDSSSKMGTVLSFSPKNNHYEDQVGVPSVKEEKIKKHGIFLNGLSWKKLSSINTHHNNQYPTQQAFKGSNNVSNGNIGGKEISANKIIRHDNIHPMIDTNKNIANALCHGAKSTSLMDKKLDLAPPAILPTNPQNSTHNKENDRNVDNLNKSTIMPTTSRSRNFTIRLSSNLSSRLPPPRLYRAFRSSVGRNSSNRVRNPPPRGNNPQDPPLQPLVKRL